MKMYATSRSERAQKGQGGNKYLETVHTVEHDNGEREEVARTTVTREGDEYSVRLVVSGDDTVTRIPVRKDTRALACMYEHPHDGLCEWYT